MKSRQDKTQPKDEHMKLGFFTLTTLAASLALLLTDAPQASALSLEKAAQEASLAETSALTSFEADEILAQASSEVYASAPNTDVNALYQDVRGVVTHSGATPSGAATSNDLNTVETLFKDTTGITAMGTISKVGSDGVTRDLTP